LKVALLIPELIKEGGGERQCVYLAKELQELGHEAVIYALEYVKDKCFPDVCSNLDIRVTGRSTFTRSGFPLLYTRIKDFFDMRHMAREIKGEFDILNPHAYPPHWAAVRLKRIERVPAVWMCNDPLVSFSENESLFKKFRRFMTFRYERRVVSELDQVTVLSQMVRDILYKDYQIKAPVVRSGVDLSKFSQQNKSLKDRIREKYGISKDVFLLLYVCIPLPHRRMEDLIAALSILVEKGRHVKLLHVGSLTYDLAYSNHILSLVKSSRLQNILIFAGSVAEAKLPSYYHACDAFVFPNEEQTWSLAVTEAMACQKPVIVSTGTGIQEVLEDYQTALLVPPRRPDLIAAKVEELMDNAVLRLTIAKQGYNFVRQNLSWRRYAEQMVDIFEEVLFMHQSSP
jgi:glycosyltransferase involved in cell wall biosynthesis